MEQPQAAAAGQRELGDLLVAYLEQVGVEAVFGVPGGAIEPFYNALARSARRGGPRPVVARHECGAAYMADGYARETGRLGVCCATTGPGATNLITGTASAYADKVPLLVVTAQTALPHFGRGALQESSCTAVNTVGMFQHCTVYNTLVSHPEQLEGKLIAAIVAAHQPPAGPAHISVPRDVLAAPWPGERPGSQLGSLLRQPDLVDEAALDHLCALVADARRIVLVVGAGCAEAADAIMELAELTGAPVLATPQGKPWVDAHHPQYRGVFGFAGHDSARAELMAPETDWVLALGSDLDEFATSGWDRIALLNERLVHIDALPEHFSRSPMARLHVYGRVATVVARLNERVRSARGPAATADPGADAPYSRCTPPRVQLDDAAKYRSDTTPIKPQRLFCELTRRFPPETRFVADAGNSFVWTTHYLHPRQQGTYRVAMGFGVMAWGVGAAVGTALGCPGTPVVCITGDGSYLMSGQEVTVAVQERLPVVFVVLNDQALGMVRHGQRLGGAEPVGFELPPVDYAAMARAAGGHGLRIESPADFTRIDTAEICNRPGPTVLDVVIDPDEVPPMGMRVRTLAE